jgi:hypothetical protein
MTDNTNIKKLSGVPPSRCISQHPREEIPMPATDNVADAHLLALGLQLEGMAAELKTICTWMDEVSELFHAEIEKFATWPDDQDEWNRWDCKAYHETLCRVEKTTEIGRSFVRANDAEYAMCERRIYPLCKRIKSFKPSTAKGRALKRWASAIGLGRWPYPDYPAAAQREQNYYACA